MSSFIDRLNKCEDYSCVFSLVKEAVEKTINRRRAGLILGLSDLPLHIGAFYQAGSNFIIMNRKLLLRVKMLENKEIVNSYLFHILLHEYIHSLGFLDENKTQHLTYSISKQFLGEKHPATLMARYGIGSLISPDGTEHIQPAEADIEIIRNFELDNLTYFS